MSEVFTGATFVSKHTIDDALNNYKDRMNSFNDLIEAKKEEFKASLSPPTLWVKLFYGGDMYKYVLRNMSLFEGTVEFLTTYNYITFDEHEYKEFKTLSYYGGDFERWESERISLTNLSYGKGAYLNPWQMAFIKMFVTSEEEQK